MPCVVADTSPLFYFACLDCLGLLRELYGEVNVPEIVWQEARSGGRRYPSAPERLEAARSAGWICIHPSRAPETEPSLRELDEGERQAILLALTLPAALLLIDERRGRKAALSLGLTSTGTIGILIEAKRRGLVETVAATLRRLREETTFWLHPDDEVRALALVGETRDSHPDLLS